MESKSRSLLKAVSWRFMGTLVTAALVFLLTGKMKTAAAVGLLDTFIKIFGFYFHERIWLKISYGLPPKGSEFQI